MLKEDNPTDNLIEIIKREGKITEDIKLVEKKNEIFMEAFHKDINLISKEIS